MLRVALVVLVVGWFVPASGGECIGLAQPVPGDVVASFAPEGTYAGHWGVDFAAEPGSVVTAPAPGTVAFAGSVVDNMAVTVDHGGGVVSTVSYLGALGVRRGHSVRAGVPLGMSAEAHGEPVLHFSTRIDDRYVDPGPLLGCVWVVPGDALRLVP